MSEVFSTVQKSSNLLFNLILGPFFTRRDTFGFEDCESDDGTDSENEGDLPTRSKGNTQKEGFDNIGRKGTLPVLASAGDL